MNLYIGVFLLCGVPVLSVLLLYILTENKLRKIWFSVPLTLLTDIFTVIYSLFLSHSLTIRDFKFIIFHIISLIITIALINISIKIFKYVYNAKNSKKFNIIVTLILIFFLFLYFICILYVLYNATISGESFQANFCVK